MAMTDEVECGCGWKYRSTGVFAQLHCDRAYEKHLRLRHPMIEMEALPCPSD